MQVNHAGKQDRGNTSDADKPPQNGLNTQDHLTNGAQVDSSSLATVPRIKQVKQDQRG